MMTFNKEYNEVIRRSKWTYTDNDGNFIKNPFEDMILRDTGCKSNSSFMYHM